MDARDPLVVAQLLRGVMSDVIQTERLLLRRAQVEDAGAMHVIMSHPLVMRYWWTPPHARITETERWIASMMAADDA